MAEYPNPLTMKYLLGAIKSRPLSYTRQGYLGRKLLPEKYVPESEITWDVIKAENGLAGFISRGGRPVPGSDMLFSQMFATLRDIGAMRVVNRDAVKTLRDPGMSNIVSGVQQRAYQKAKRKVREALEWCDDRVEATIEYMIMSAYQGTLVWPPAGIPTENWQPEWGDVTMHITFPLRAEFKQSATTLTGYGGRTGGGVAWNDPSADPFLDLEVIAEYIAEVTGLNARGSTIICSSSVLSYLTQNTKLLNRLAGTDRGIDFLDVGLLKEFVATNIGFKFQTYDAQWTYRTSVDSESGPTINAVRFLPRGRCIILPPGEDYGFLATTEVAGPNDKYYVGKYAWVNSDKEPPWETRVGVSGAFFPLLTRAESIFVFDAWS